MRSTWGYGSDWMEILAEDGGETYLRECQPRIVKPISDARELLLERVLAMRMTLGEQEDAKRSAVGKWDIAHQF